MSTLDLRPEDIDLRKLRTLRQVALRGSITAAAESLCYTPSAVSQQIKRLERDLDLVLVERHPRGVHLTEAGRVIVEHSDRIDRELRSLRERLIDIAELREGTARLGSFATVGSSLLPLVLKRFLKEYPAVQLTVLSARLATLIQKLRDREVDLALLWDYSWSRVDDPSLSCIHLLDDPTRLLVASTHNLASKVRARIGELNAEGWIIRAEGHPVGEVLYRSARASGFEPRVIFEAHDYQEAQAMVAAGLGVALAPQLALTNLRPDVKALSLGRDAPARRLLLGRLRQRPVSPIEQGLVDAFLIVTRRFETGGV